MNIDGENQEPTSVPENTAAETQKNDSGASADPKENRQDEEKQASDEGSQDLDDDEKDRTFTREEVTKIIKKRLDRSSKKLWERLGIEGEEKLDEYLEGNAKTAKDLEESKKGLEESAARYAELEAKYRQTLRDYLYLKSEIIPERFADLDRCFEGAELNEESLAKAIEGHPEFVKPKQSIPQQLGQRQNEQQSRETERELAEKLFHVKF